LFSLQTPPTRKSWRLHSLSRKNAGVGNLGERHRAWQRTGSGRRLLKDVAAKGEDRIQFTQASTNCRGSLPRKRSRSHVRVL
jgi:hypothetical protein